MRSLPRHQSAPLWIGGLSRLTGVHIETIRYYERIGMLAPPPRGANGRRIYGPAEIGALSFIRRARALGFSLDEVRTLLSLSSGGGGDTCAAASRLAARHLDDVRAKIAGLRAMEHVLADAVQRCAAADLDRCPMIDALSAG